MNDSSVDRRVLIELLTLRPHVPLLPRSSKSRTAFRFESGLT